MKKADSRIGAFLFTLAASILVSMSSSAQSLPSIATKTDALSDAFAKVALRALYINETGGVLSPENLADVKVAADTEPEERVAQQINILSINTETQGMLVHLAFQKCVNAHILSSLHPEEECTEAPQTDPDVLANRALLVACSKAIEAELKTRIASPATPKECSPPVPHK